MNTDDKVQLVYSSQNNQELSQNYDLWAKNYDQDLEDEFGYFAPQPTVEVLVKYLPKSAKILDAGAGTGLVGQLLQQRGYDDLEGMDLSPGMLEIARKQNIYKALYEMALGEPLDFATDYFDAIVSVGTFTYNHAPSNSFDELLRITKPGGYIIFTLRLDFYEDSDFNDKMSALEESGQWKLVEITEAFPCLAKSEPDVYAKIWAYQTC
ncbi:class I SAM-dependent DNA methyltransferase [Calothrix rhizosoleniae]|uniref:class I SAM-dependent DNA methyltransferase n=1 Tax=Calothrix rhizosoleniae TaxID=888997 RepID=UPI000B49C2ED|nr:class I SAM-dependent methyltransferase [Calothrix rhizosoleniae]